MIKPVFKIKTKKTGKHSAELVLSPLEPGFGHTLGNGLRRVLFTSLSGLAVTQIKIKGVRHQYTTLPGLKEDIVEFSLNVKRVRLRLKQGQGPFKAILEVQGPGEIKAGDIQTPAEIEVVNKDFVLGHLATKKHQLRVEMEVEKGFGYQGVEGKERKIGVIVLDAVFSPVLKVTYGVKSTRVGRRTDLDELTMKVETDGTIKPLKALEQAARILVNHFHHVYEPVFEEKEEEEGGKAIDEVRKLNIEEIGLPTRIANALMKGGFKTVAGLLQADREEVIKVKNLGEKSFAVLVKKLKKKGVDLEAPGQG